MKTRRIIPSLAALGFLLTPCGAQDAGTSPTKAAGESYVFKTQWGGEKIDLPPRFAPGMKLKGIEEIRFAPGMFQAGSDTFFSYVFLFAVSADQKLTPAVIEKEILVYYQGLSSSLMKRKGKEVDTGKFVFKLGKPEPARETASGTKPAAVAQYTGKLDWVEPFATLKPQVLHFELQAWSNAPSTMNYLFVCASPKAINDKEAIWKEMRKIRSSFEVKSAAAGKKE